MDNNSTDKYNVDYNQADYNYENDYDLNNKQPLSVDAWKRIITLTVIFLLLTLTILSIVFGIRSHLYKTTLNDENVIDLRNYGNLNPIECNRVLRFVSGANPNTNLIYQTKYPNCYVENDFVYTDNSDEKVCYLTFDDGPDVVVTTAVLDILKEFDIKATFFVIYKDTEADRNLYKRIIDEGHTLGIHTASHNYTKIYSSIDSYLRDFNKISNQLEQITGIRPDIFRFPGGSINAYNIGIYHELIAEMLRRGYTYYDWNLSSGDNSAFYVTADEIKESILNSSNRINKKIIMLHDGTGHIATAEALPSVITDLKEKGYDFRPLTKNVAPICFGY